MDLVCQTANLVRGPDSEYTLHALITPPFIHIRKHWWRTNRKQTSGQNYAHWRGLLTTSMSTVHCVQLSIPIPNTHWIVYRRGAPDGHLQNG
jgi:hypothetical protein